MAASTPRTSTGWSVTSQASSGVLHRVRKPPALARVAEEDPSLSITTDEDTGQTLLSGMGELHLEVIQHRLEREFHARLRAGRPQVVIPHNYDQFYWAQRVEQLGVGASGPRRDDLTLEALVQALWDQGQIDVQRDGFDGVEIFCADRLRGEIEEGR